MKVRNDLGQYDELVDAWWDDRGPFAMLQWIAAARAALVPPSSQPNAVLLDLGCGGGLLAPHVSKLGYEHIGLDATESALGQARLHGITVVRGDLLNLPFADDSADVVCAGEILEHVTDLRRAISESSRVLKPGGKLVVDTVADTWLARFLVVTVAERIPGGAPPGIHDPRLFVDRKVLVDEYARHGIKVQLRGLRPSFVSMLAWQSRRTQTGRMVPTRPTSVLFQGWGTKA